MQITDVLRNIGTRISDLPSEQCQIFRRLVRECDPDMLPERNRPVTVWHRLWVVHYSHGIDARKDFVTHGKEIGQGTGEFSQIVAEAKSILIRFMYGLSLIDLLSSPMESEAARQVRALHKKSESEYESQSAR